jgi:hypothetical protein
MVLSENRFPLFGIVREAAAHAVSDRRPRTEKPVARDR